MKAAYRNSFYVFVFLLTALPLYWPNSALACGLEKHRDKIIVALLKDEGECKEISVAYPKNIYVADKPETYWHTSNALLVYSIDNTFVFRGMLQQFNYPDKEGYSQAIFCLTDNAIDEASVSLTYDVLPVEPEERTPEGIVIRTVYMCMDSITIDNLDELLAQGK